MQTPPEQLKTAEPVKLCQLSKYRALHGSELVVGAKTFTIEGITESDIGAVATFKAKRASYMGVECINTKVKSLPGAEVWSINSGRRELASFAVHEGRII